MQTVRIGAIIAATMTTGLTAGVFALYAHTIMPGLATTDDRTFIAAFQSIDRAIINPWFMISAFGGAIVALVVATATSLGRPVLPWVAVALVLQLVAVVVTVAVNVPLNDAIKAAGDPGRTADPAAVRAAFHEARWVAWNLVRVATSVVGFGALCWALVLAGRTQS
jgi:uncharacterized membrane protein